MMAWRLLADLTLVVHLLFVFFVLFGGLLCLRHSAWAGLHLPTVAWGIWVEWTGGRCPLTPMENHFRALANDQGYSGGFVEHYLIPVLYPGQWSVSMQWLAGGVVLALNLMVYLFVACKRRKCRSAVDE